MNTGTHKPYRKLNDERLYIHTKSNDPGNILKQLPISIETRLFNLPSNPKIFYEAFKYWQNTLNQSGYYKLYYKPRNNKNENKKVNRPTTAKETSPGSTCLFQRTSLTTSVNFPFFKLKIIFQTSINILKYLTKTIIK